MENWLQVVIVMCFPVDNFCGISSLSKYTGLQAAVGNMYSTVLFEEWYILFTQT